MVTLSANVYYNIAVMTSSLDYLSPAFEISLILYKYTKIINVFTQTLLFLFKRVEVSIQNNRGENYIILTSKY